MDGLSLIRRGCAVVLLAAAVACNSTPETALFADLALIHNGLDFPRTQEELRRCRTIGQASCLKVHNRVVSAKKSLFSHSTDQALRLTLDTITRECAKQQPDLQEQLACTGAVTALYFFPSSDHDRSIRELLAGAQPAVAQALIANGALWLTNRDDKPAWRAWLAEVSLTVPERQSLLTYLALPAYDHLTIDHLD